MATRILLVEDNPGDAVIFREKLNASDLDFKLVHAKRLSEGLERIQDDAFDILMVDLSLPDAQGMEAVDKLREVAPDSPLIVLTGLDDATAAAEAKQRGAVDYLVKWYVDSVSLARYVRYAIEQYRVSSGAADGVAAQQVVEVEGVMFNASADEGEAPSAQTTQDGPEAESALAAVATAPSASSPQPSPRPAAVTSADAAVPESVSDIAREAIEAALDFVEQSQRQSSWLAGVLRTALDAERGVEVKPELIDVLDQLNQVVREHRDLAMELGLPMRVTSQRKKVMAHADRNVVDEILTRMVVDAVHEARHDGLQLSAEVEGEVSTISVQWHSTGNERVAHAALGRRLVEVLAERTGGTLDHETDATGEHTLTIRLPGRPEA